MADNVEPPVKSEAASDWTLFNTVLRTTARIIVQGKPITEGMSVDRAVVTALLLAAFEAIRVEWENTAKTAGLEVELAVARKLMERDGYGADKFPAEPICGLPGAKPYICTVDGKEAVCYDASMTNIMPLSAYYTNKVREAIDMAADVGALIEQARKEKDSGQPDSGAGGERGAPAGTPPAT